MSMERWRELSWRRELPPVLVVAGLTADYLSPAALWTVLLPLASVAALATLRHFGKAALVVLLSSWIAIPAAASALCSLEAARGGPVLYRVEGAIPPLPDGLIADAQDVPAALTESNRFLRRVVWSFAEIHNVIAIENAAR